MKTLVSSSPLLPFPFLLLLLISLPSSLYSHTIPQITSTHPPISKQMPRYIDRHYHSIQYSASSKSVSFSLPSPAVFLTFTPSTTISTIISTFMEQLNMRSDRYTCNFKYADYDNNKNSVNDIDDHRPISSILSSPNDEPDVDLSFECINKEKKGSPNVQVRYPVTPSTSARHIHNSTVTQLQQYTRSLLRSNGSLPYIHEYPYESVQILSDVWSGVYGYYVNFIKNHWGKIHPFPYYTGKGDTGLYHLRTGKEMSDVNEKMESADDAAADDTESISMSIVADWGAGTYESHLCALHMMSPHPPHWTIHVGDVYYVGTPDEIRSNMLGVAPPKTRYGVSFPHGTLGSFALQGNHEMYSRGYGYFDVLLPTLGIRDNDDDSTPKKLKGQKASYFAFINKHFKVIGLDTGYNTYSPLIDNNNNDLPSEITEWLVNTVKLDDENDKRALILLSHHQALSGFEDAYPAAPQQIAKILKDSNRTILWLWGHEHRLAIYNKNTLTYNDGENNSTLSLYSRCIGNSGFPSTVEALPKHARSSNLQAYDDRLYKRDSGWFNIPMGFNGWIKLNFKGKQVKIEYMTTKEDENGKLSEKEFEYLMYEIFENDGRGSVELVQQEYINPNVTRVLHVN